MASSRAAEPLPQRGGMKLLSWRLCARRLESPPRGFPQIEPPRVHVSNRSATPVVFEWGKKGATSCLESSFKAQQWRGTGKHGPRREVNVQLQAAGSSPRRWLTRPERPSFVNNIA